MNKIVRILILAIISKQILWMAFIPLWQFPDEQAHFGQVAYLSAGRPPTTGNDLTKEILISERILGTERDTFGNNRYTYHPDYNIPYTMSSEGYFEKEIKSLPQTHKLEMVKKEATAYPPLYYYPGFLIFKAMNTDLITDVFIVRLLNIIYSVTLAWFAYKTYSLVFKESKIVLLGIVLVTFQPMFSFISAGFNSDNIYNVLAVIIVYLCVLLLKHGITPKNAFYSVITVILALLSKPQAFILILFFAFPLIFRLLSAKKLFSKFLLLAVLILLSSPFIINSLTQTQFFPEVNLTFTLANSNKFWEFLKNSILQNYRQTLPWYWGVFRWLSLGFDINIYRLLNITSIICLLGVFIFFLKSIFKKVFSFRFITLMFFFYTFLVYFFSLTVWDFSFYLSHGFSFGIQGRYYFPLITVIIGILLIGIQSITSFKKFLFHFSYVGLGLGMIIFHQYSFYKVTSTYYGFFPLDRFISLASQYKPQFYKSSILVYFLLADIVTILIFSILFVTYDRKKTLF